MLRKGRKLSKQTEKSKNFFFSFSKFRSTTMTYLCRFNQRNRLLEIPSTSEYYNQQSGISHEHLKQLISIEKYFLSIIYSFVM